MTTIASKLVCLTGLSLFSVLVAAAAPPTATLSIEGSDQKASNLCWAAVAEMAVNAVAHPDPPMSQARQTAFAAAGIKQLPPTPAQAAEFAHQLGECTPVTIEDCNKRWEPVLEGIRDVPRSFTALSEDQLKEEIGVSERPVIFAWQYPDQNARDRPTRAHYLIATGYNSASTRSFLKIWDPWPVGSGAARSIRYSTYAGETLDMGLPVEHLVSYPGLQNVVQPNPPSSVIVDGGAASARRSSRSVRPRFREVSFSAAMRRALPKRQAEAIVHELSEGRTDSAAMTLGTPFPILALHVNDIVANQNRPERLLTKRTKSVLYPVMVRDQVVDSFLMANIGGRWVETGYANTAITAQLVRWRKENAGRPDTAQEKDFFVLAVPQYSAFFTSFKPGKAAMAIAATTDPLIRTREGRSQPAVEVLKNIAGAELRQRAVEH